MVFYSQLIGREILDQKGNKVGKLKDFTADFSKKIPSITDLVFKEKGKLRRIPVKYLESLEKTGIFLNEVKDKLELFDVDMEKDMLLEDVILDQQVVDIDGQKVVRANDIVLEKIGDEFCFTSIDIGIKGIVRRLGLSKLNMTLLATVPQNLIKWENVETLRGQLKDIQLKVSHEKLARMHPADIADIVESLSHKERAIFFKSLDNEKAADTLEESEPDVQRSVVRHLKKDRIAQILENMTPDEAVDLLGLLPKEKIEEYLSKMEPTKALALRNIMRYEEDEAGGIMTTEYVSVPKDFTADQTINLLRENGPKVEQIHNLYVVDSVQHLLGRISMKDLLLNKGDAKVEDIMKKKIFKVNTEASAKDIQRLFKKYNLLSLPVVNSDNKLVGVITHDDIFDIALQNE
jgi:magnesium transporter